MKIVKDRTCKWLQVSERVDVAIVYLKGNVAVGVSAGFLGMATDDAQYHYTAIIWRINLIKWLIHGSFPISRKHKFEYITPHTNQ